MMKKFIVSIFFLVCLSLQAQVSNRWLILNGNYEPSGGVSLGWCALGSQVSFSGGVATMTGNTGSYTCNGHSSSNTVGAMMSSPFSFTYGKVVAVARAAPLGLTSAIWMWGGASGTSGYPSTCIAAIKALGQYMSSCTADTNNAYEIDIAEFTPGTIGSDSVHNNTLIWNNGSIVTQAPNSNFNYGADLSAAYHTYELDWMPTYLIYKLDGITTATYSLTAGTFNQPMFLILDTEQNTNSGSGTLPLSLNVKSIEVWDQSNKVIFSENFSNISGDVLLAGKTTFSGKEALK